MTRKTPTLQEWKKLYEKTIEFKKQECWNWMWDNDIFGVQNPETGMIGYCIVMGGGGEQFGLGVYRGTEGLNGVLSIISGDIGPTDMDALHIQNCLIASFEDRKFLQKEDHDIIKKLGLKFRGHNEWPLFRDYTPGYHPWFINSDDAQFLTIALEQSIEVALKYKDNPDSLVPNKDSRFLVRIPVRKEKGMEWKEKWLKPKPLESRKINDVPIDNKSIEKIKNVKKGQNCIWEIGAFYTPQAVRDRSERPYYPKMILFMDHHSGLIMSYSMSKQGEYKSDFIKEFFKLVKNVKFLPEAIFASNEEILELLLPITNELEIELYKTDDLEMLDEAYSAMFDFFR